MLVEDPIDLWLRAYSVTRKLTIYFNSTRGVTVVMAWEGTILMGIGEGKTSAEAAAKCCNDIMAKGLEDRANPLRPKRL